MELPMQILLNRKWSSQDAIGLFDAIITTFKKHNLSSLLQEVIFLCSDGVSETVGKVRLGLSLP